MYPEENPTVKQTEIGGMFQKKWSIGNVAEFADIPLAMFGVERR